MTPNEFEQKLNALLDKRQVIDIELSFLTSDYFKSLTEKFREDAVTQSDEIVGPGGIYSGR